jgi:hypothetical protein
MRPGHGFLWKVTCKITENIPPGRLTNSTSSVIEIGSSTLIDSYHFVPYKCQAVIGFL